MANFLEQLLSDINAANGCDCESCQARRAAREKPKTDKAEASEKKPYKNLPTKDDVALNVGSMMQSAMGCTCGGCNRKRSAPNSGFHKAPFQLVMISAGGELFPVNAADVWAWLNESKPSETEDVAAATIVEAPVKADKTMREIADGLKAEHDARQSAKAAGAPLYKSLLGVDTMTTTRLEAVRRMVEYTNRVPVAIEATRHETDLTKKIGVTGDSIEAYKKMAPMDRLEAVAAMLARADGFQRYYEAINRVINEGYVINRDYAKSLKGFLFEAIRDAIGYGIGAAGTYQVRTPFGTVQITFRNGENAGYPDFTYDIVKEK